MHRGTLLVTILAVSSFTWATNFGLLLMLTDDYTTVYRLLALLLPITLVTLAISGHRGSTVTERDLSPATPVSS
jgi:hypothetical protein